MNLSEIIKSEYNKSISECTNEEIYNALLYFGKKQWQKENSIKIQRRNYTIFQQNF